MTHDDLFLMKSFSLKIHECQNFKLLIFYIIMADFVSNARKSRQVGFCLVFFVIHVTAPVLVT